MTVSSRLGVVAELRRADLAEDPLVQFRRWFEEARPALRLPEAMAVATAAPDGGPSVRMLLLKAADERGFVFFTGYVSRKGAELDRIRARLSSSTGIRSDARCASKGLFSACPQPSRRSTSRRGRRQPARCSRVAAERRARESRRAGTCCRQARGGR
jgi:hypothetical protein